MRFFTPAATRTTAGFITGTIATLGFGYGIAKAQKAEEKRLLEENPGATVTFEHKVIPGVGSYYQSKVHKPEEEQQSSNNKTFSRS